MKILYLSSGGKAALSATSAKLVIFLCFSLHPLRRRISSGPATIPAAPLSHRKLSFPLNSGASLRMSLLASDPSSEAWRYASARVFAPENGAKISFVRASG